MAGGRTPLTGAALAHSGRVEEPGLEGKAGLSFAPNVAVRRYLECALSDNPTYLAPSPRILEGMAIAGAPEG